MILQEVKNQVIVNTKKGIIHENDSWIMPLNLMIKLRMWKYTKWR